MLPLFSSATPKVKTPTKSGAKPKTTATKAKTTKKVAAKPKSRVTKKGASNLVHWKSQEF